MHNFKKAAAALVVAAAALPASAAVTVFDKDDTTVSIDASFNTFLVQTSTEGTGNDRDQSRVKQGFLPNWIGFNFGKTVGDLKFGGRSSFWVSTNSSNGDATNSLIDTRQFYGTIDGDWGQILIGKDFTLFNRNNIFLDEILLGFGLTADGLGLIDTGNVSFGNIGAGYIYPLPTSQIRYTSPASGGFKLEAALIDPSNTTGTTVTAVADDPATVADETVAGNTRGEESSPRLEAQLTYSSGAFTGWLGALHQKSDNVQSVESEGISYGFKVKSGGFGVHISGYDGEGLGLLIGPADASALGLGAAFVASGGTELDSSGILTQVSYAAGKNRFVLSRGESEIENNGTVQTELENQTVALFHSVNSVLTIAAEYSKTEYNTEEVDTVAVGAIINF